MSRKLKILLIFLIFIMLLPKPAYAHPPIFGLLIIIIIVGPVVLAAGAVVLVKLLLLKKFFNRNIKQKILHTIGTTILEFVFLMVFAIFWYSNVNKEYVSYSGTFLSIYLTALFPNLLLLQQNKEYFNFENIVYDKKNIIGAMIFALIFPVFSAVLFDISVVSNDGNSLFMKALKSFCSN